MPVVRGKNPPATAPRPRPRGTSAPAPFSAPRCNSTAPKPRITSAGHPSGPQFTHTDKILFPGPGFTKADVLGFYERISPDLLPHLKDRPVTLERLPDGLASPSAPHFWQKNAPAFYPSWIPRVDLPTERGKTVQYVLVNNLDSLLYLVNQGTITFHIYFSTTHNLACPDFVLFDLDIGQSTFANAVTIARHIHQHLDALSIPSIPKTSGKTGLHILVPWRQPGGYDAARQWALQIATSVCERLPDIAATARLKSARRGRVYVDVIQNALGHHVVPPYALRATPTATVSTPLPWDQVAPRLDPRRFTLRTVFDQLSKHPPDPALSTLLAAS